MGRFLPFPTLGAVFVLALLTFPLLGSLDPPASLEDKQACSASFPSSPLLDIESHLMTASEVEEKKAVIGVRDPSKEYNLLVEGHGTGLAPPSEEEWSRMAGNVSVVESVSSSALRYAQSFDLSSQTTFPTVGNQGSQGSCAAWAVTYYSYGYQEASDNGWTAASSGSKNQLLSPAWTYDRVSTGKGSGSSMTENALVLIDWGVPSMAAMPYDENEWTSWGNDLAFRQAPLHRASETNDIYYSAANPLETINSVKNLIQSGIPVNFAIWADSSWYYFGDGNYILSSIEYHPTDSPNHAQTLVGWDDSLSDDGESGAFKIVNSWGSGWGDDGYYWLTYDAFKEIGARLELTYIEDRPDYNPSLLAVWQFNDSPSKNAGFSLDLGTGSSKASKDPYYYDYSGPYPSFMCLDVTEFSSKYGSGTHDFHLSIGSGTHNGVLSSFKLEGYDSGYSPGRATYDSGQSSSGVVSTPCSVSVTLNNYPSLRLEEAVDTSSLSLKTEGTATWVAVDNAHYLGSYSVQSGDIADQRSSWMNLTATGPGTIAFQWKVSSELNYDFLSFQKDGVSLKSISGEAAWAREVFEVETGAHQLSWIFSKDAAVSSGAGCGWVDQLVWIPPSSETSIRINSDAELLVAASAHGWSGSGSWNDPIAISDMDIDAQGRGTCLYLGNTTLYLAIKDCDLFNASFSKATYDDGSSLILFNVQNVLVQDNQLTQSAAGISVTGGSRVSVVNSSISYNSQGMILVSSQVEVTLNRFISNSLYGLAILSGAGSKVQGNLFQNNHESGAVFDLDHVQASDLGGNAWSTSYGNLWSDWTSPDANRDGIVDSPYLIEGGASDLKPLTSLLTPPHELVGACLSNEVHLSWKAPYFSDGEEVLQYKIYKMAGNTTSFILREGISSSYIDKQVSQGSSYIYTITALSAAGESAPSNSIIVHVPDTTPPTIDITGPGEGTFLKVGSVEVTWSGWDGGAGLDHYEFQIDGGTWIGMGLSTSRTLSGLAQGQHLVVVKAVDKEGNSNIDVVSFVVDFLPPVVNIVAPQEASIWNSSLHIEFEVSDQNPGESSASISGYYQISGDDLRVSTDLPLPDGAYLLTIHSTDKAGNSVSVYVSFIVDSSIPEVRITSGQNGAILTGADTEVVWEGEDDYLLDHFEISLDGASFSSVSDAHSCALTELSDGFHTFKVRVVDLGGNTALASVSFIVDTAPPRILAFSPHGNNVSIDCEVSITFTSDLDENSVIVLVQEVILQAEILHQGTTFRFSPASGWEYGSNYTVQVWARDLAANELYFSWEFSTQDLGSISGWVLDQQGKGVLDASVILDDLESIRTEADGSFSLSASPGSHTLRIVKEGYLNLTENLIVQPGQDTKLGSLSLIPKGQLDPLFIILVIVVCATGVAAFALWRAKK